MCPTQPASLFVCGCESTTNHTDFQWQQNFCEINRGKKDNTEIQNLWPAADDDILQNSMRSSTDITVGNETTTLLYFVYVLYRLR